MSKKILVVLDPGHYPNYNKGASPGYYEGNKMYDFTEYERDALKSYGIDVIITRKRDKDMDLYARGQVAVKNGKGYDEVIFISNHSNGFNGSAYGVVAYRSAHLPESTTLGQKLIDAIVGVMKPITGITYSRGVKTRLNSSNSDYYGVLRGSVSGAKSVKQAENVPVKYSFIIEHGFHDNVKECEFLNNNANLKKMAEAEAKVIADYFGLIKTSAPTVKELYRIRKSWIDVKSQLGAYASLESAKEIADKNSGYSVYDNSGKCVYNPNVSTSVTAFKVRVKIKDLNIRKGPGTNHEKNGVIAPGIYTITEVATGKGSNAGWGKLKSGIGYISLDYIERV